MAKGSFAGITGEGTETFDDHFNSTDYGSKLVCESKKTFKHKEDGLNFDYKYVVFIEDLGEYDSEWEGQVLIELKLVVMPKSLNKKKKDEVASCSGIAAKDVTVIDIAEYGFYVPLGREQFHVTSSDLMKSKRAQQVLTAIASIYEMLDAMIGFYLDRPINRMGTTGWDTIYECVKGRNAIQATLKRYQ